MDIRDEMMRGMAAELDVPQELIGEALDAYDTAMREAQRQRDAAIAYIQGEMPRISAELTRDFLRPALAAAGVENVEQYQLSWVREEGFRPGIFAQEGVEYGRCAVGYDCPPWPQYVYDQQRQWPVPVFTQGEFDENVKPCRPIPYDDDDA